VRYVLAFLLLAHGIAHLPGFLVGWQLGSFAELPFRTTVISHSLDVGIVGARLVGTAWMIASFGFVVLAASVAFAAASPKWLPVALGLSTALCILGWPEARIGLAMNALIAIAFLAARSG
jgi:hypothetical protein